MKSLWRLLNLGLRSAGLLIAPPHKSIVTTRRSLMYGKSDTANISWDPQLAAKKMVADIKAQGTDKAQGTKTLKAITTGKI